MSLTGYEVMYVDIGDVLSMLIGSPSQKPSFPQQRQHPGQQQQHQKHRQASGFIAKLMMTLAKGYRLIKTR